MNIIYYGRKNLMMNLKALIGRDFTITEATNLDSVARLVQRSDSIFMVDMLANDAQTACALANCDASCPLVVIHSNHLPDWAKMRTVEAHGFISASAPREELIARLRGVWKRFQLNLTIAK